jgi:ferredoxin--NADP+ reductase
MPLPPDKFLRARITERTDLSAELWKIRVDPGAEFQFTAGQYTTLALETPKGVIERPYSIASSPYESGLEFFLELVPAGEMTPALHQLHLGDSLSLRKQAKGLFILDKASGRRNHLFLSTVTGVAPFVSMARTLRKDWKDGIFPEGHKLFLLDGASRSWELGYRGELEKYAEELAWFTYVPTVSRPWEDAGWHGETGRVDDILRKYGDLWGLQAGNTVAYLCGHPEMIERGKGILHRHGWEKAAIKEENFFVAANVRRTGRKGAT